MDDDSIDDADLMRSVARGDPSSLDKLIRRHGQEMLTFLQRTTRDAVRSEDIFQDVFLTVWQKRHQYRFPKPVRPWLYTIALNMCREHFRKRSNHTLPLFDSDWIAVGDLPEDAMVAGETSDMVEAALARLPRQQRVVVVMRIWSGMSYSQIARILHVPESTVRSRMKRSLDGLREQLQTRLP